MSDESPGNVDIVEEPPGDLATNGAKPTSKIPTLTIPSDDCTVSSGQVINADGTIVDPGQPIAVHVGEHIEIIPVATVAEVISLGKLQAAIPGSDTLAADLAEQLQVLCNELSQRVVGWTWTDMLGVALPQPYQRPDVLAGLTSEELLYLVGATQQRESQVERKNGSAPSDSTSLAPRAPSGSRRKQS